MIFQQKKKIFRPYLMLKKQMRPCIIIFFIFIRQKSFSVQLILSKENELYKDEIKLNPTKETESFRPQSPRHRKLMKSVSKNLIDDDLKVFFERSLSREKSKIVNINLKKSTI